MEMISRAGEPPPHDENRPPRNDDRQAKRPPPNEKYDENRPPPHNEVKSIPNQD
jgi:hypothetical protein